MIATEKNNSGAGKGQGGKWLRRLAPIAVLCGGLGIALLAGARVSQKEAPAPVDTGAVAPLTVAEKPLTSQYQPSRFAGVMVRHIPDPVPANARSNARWLVPAGKKRPPTSPNPYNTSITTKTDAVTMPNGGGVSRRIPASLMPAERLRLAKPGAMQRP